MIGVPTSSVLRVISTSRAGLIVTLACLGLALVFPLVGCGERPETSNAANRGQTAAPKASDSNHKNPVAVIETDVGTIRLELLDNESPATVENFRRLAQRGFYNGLIFHRVISGFMIQGGDPKGDGSGGQTASGQPLPNEVNSASPLYQAGYQRGVVAMANRGGRPETGTSQFFIMHQNYALPPSYTIFGRVTAGMEVVDKIAAAPTVPPNNRPVDPVKMNIVTVQ